MNVRNIDFGLSDIQRLVQTTRSSFNPTDLELVRNLLGKYKYGKDLDYLLRSENGFKVSVQDGVIVQINSIRRNSYKGICGELANSLGLSLIKNRDFNLKYDVLIASTSHAKYFPAPSVHAVLLIAPKEVNIRQQLISRPLEFPEEVILADPSLGEIEAASEYNKRDNEYKLSTPNFGNLPHFGGIEELAGDAHFVLTPNNDHPMVIGFTKDYLPGNFLDEETIYYVFRTDGKNQVNEVVLASYDPKQGPTYINLSDFPKGEKQVLNLEKLLNKLKADLNLL